MNDLDLFESSAQIIKDKELLSEIEEYEEHELCLCGHSFRAHSYPSGSPCYIENCSCQEFKLLN